MFTSETLALAGEFTVTAAIMKFSFLIPVSTIPHLIDVRYTFIPFVIQGVIMSNSIITFPQVSLPSRMKCLKFSKKLSSLLVVLEELKMILINFLEVNRNHIQK